MAGVVPRGRWSDTGRRERLLKGQLVFLFSNWGNTTWICGGKVGVSVVRSATLCVGG
jgi:hypothetical protein